MMLSKEPIEKLYKPIDVSDEQIEIQWLPIKKLLDQILENNVIFQKESKDMNWENPIHAKYLYRGKINNDNFFQIMDKMDGITLMKPYTQLKNEIASILNAHDAINEKEEVRLTTLMFTGNEKLFPMKLDYLIHSMILLSVFYGKDIVKNMVKFFIRNDLVNIFIFQAFSRIDISDRMIIENHADLFKMKHLRNDDKEVETLIHLDELNKEITRRGLGDLNDYVFLRRSITIPILFPEFDKSHNKTEILNRLRVWGDDLTIPIYQIFSLELDHSIYPSFQFEIASNFNLLNKICGGPVIKIMDMRSNIPSHEKKEISVGSYSFKIPAPFSYIPHSIIEAVDYWIRLKHEQDAKQKCSYMRYVLEHIFKTDNQFTMSKKVTEITNTYNIKNIVTGKEIKKFMRKMGNPSHHAQQSDDSGKVERFQFSEYLFEKILKFCRDVLIEKYQKIIQSEKSYIYHKDTDKVYFDFTYSENYKRNPRSYEKLYFAIKNGDKDNSMNNIHIRSLIKYEVTIDAVECKRRYNLIKNQVLKSNENFSVGQVRSGNCVFKDAGNGIIYMHKAYGEGMKMIPYCTNNGTAINPHEILLSMRRIPNPRKIELRDGKPFLTRTDDLDPLEVAKFAKQKGIEAALDEWDNLNKHDIKLSIDFLEKQKCQT